MNGQGFKQSHRFLILQTQSQPFLDRIKEDIESELYIESNDTDVLIFRNTSRGFSDTLNISTERLPAFIIGTRCDYLPRLRNIYMTTKFHWLRSIASAGYRTR